MDGTALATATTTKASPICRFFFVQLMINLAESNLRSMRRMSIGEH